MLISARNSLKMAVLANGAGKRAARKQEQRQASPTKGLLVQALAHHRTGRLAEAAQGYRAVLAADPNCSDAHMVPVRPKPVRISSAMSSVSNSSATSRTA